MEEINYKPIPKKKMTEAQLANIEGHKFSKGHSGNPSGRPKNRINVLLKTIISKGKMNTLKHELSKEEINTIERLMLLFELSDLQLVAKACKTPAYMKTLAMAIIIDMKNGKTTTVDKLRDRQYGTINQKFEMSGELTFADLLMRSGLTEED